MPLSPRSRHTCLLCGPKASHRLVHRGIRYAPRAQVWRCVSCGLVGLWPLPTARELDAYYRIEYVREYAVPPIAERYRDDMPEAKVRARRARSLVGGRDRLLEVGAGSGAFLNAMRPFVRSATAVEPDGAGRAFITQQLELPAYASVDSLPDGSYDVIAMFHVLEHVADPDPFLRRLLARLAPGGRLVVEVPNVDDALLAVYRVKQFPAFYYQKAHLYYYSPLTLRAVLAGAGFVAKVQGIQRYDLSNHVQWMLTGRPGGIGHYEMLTSSTVDAAYADALIRAGHADTLWAVARRRGGLRRRPKRGRKTSR